MRRNGDRTMTVKKDKLIQTIKDNKETHIKAFAAAEIAYKEEALKQLEDLKKEVKGGSLDITLYLTTPVDNRKNYDKIMAMFEWDVLEEVELTQQEFNEYILDETEANRHALMSNSMYLG